MNERSRATRTFVSMLVLFFLRRPGTPSKPMEGEDSELGLGRVLSMDMVSEAGDIDTQDFKEEKRQSGANIEDIYDTR